MTALFRVSYDRGSDVLYVASAHYGPSYGEEDAPGLIWEYRDDDGSLVGVTVMDFGSYWKPRFAELVSQVASHFHVPERRAKSILEQLDG